MSKQKYYNDYVTACKMIAEQEVKKPRAERAPIPSIEVTDDGADVAAGAVETTGCESSEVEQEPSANNGAKRSSNEGKIDNARAEKRQRLEDTTVVTVRTRSQLRQQRENASVVASTVALVSPESTSKRKNSGILQTAEPESSTATTSPGAGTDPAVDSERNANAEEQKIQETRDKLAKVLSKRSGEGNGDGKISQRIKAKIDELDEALIDLILLQESNDL